MKCSIYSVLHIHWIRSVAVARDPPEGPKGTQIGFSLKGRKKKNDTKSC